MGTNTTRIWGFRAEHRAAGPTQPSQAEGALPGQKGAAEGLLAPC